MCSNKYFSKIFITKLELLQIAKYNYLIIYIILTDFLYNIHIFRWFNMYSTSKNLLLRYLTRNHSLYWWSFSFNCPNMHCFLSVALTHHKMLAFCASSNIYCIFISVSVCMFVMFIVECFRQQLRLIPANKQSLYYRIDVVFFHPSYLSLVYRSLISCVPFVWLTRQENTRIWMFIIIIISNF